MLKLTSQREKNNNILSNVHIQGLQYSLKKENG